MIKKLVLLFSLIITSGATLNGAQSVPGAILELTLKLSEIPIVQKTMQKCYVDRCITLMYAAHLSEYMLKKRWSGIQEDLSKVKIAPSGNSTKESGYCTMLYEDNTLWNKLLSSLMLGLSISSILLTIPKADQIPKSASVNYRIFLALNVLWRKWSAFMVVMYSCIFTLYPEMLLARLRIGVSETGDITPYSTTQKNSTAVSSFLMALIAGCSIFNAPT